VPAVLLFHGNGGSARDMEAGSGLSELADRRGFVAVYPQGLSVGAGQAFWASSGRVELGIDELRFTADLLDHIQARLCVDPARVAAAGHSAGGGVTARLACELAGHGTADEVLPYGGQGASVASPLPLPALPAWLAEWATRDGCPGDPAVFLDTAEVTGVRWTGCRDGAEVVHYRINGGGHDLPVTIAGQPIARVLWDFVAAHPIPG
jgi:polyhydroxybutyrate depolymerase